jgi:cellulose synthase (UDP-forming)
MFMSPIVALLINKDVVTAEPGGMLFHFVPTFIAGYLIWLAGRPLMQPRNLMISWRGVVLHAARWPIILRAIFAAAFKIKKPYMITPKGDFAQTAPSLMTYRPFLLLGLASSAALTISAVHYSATAPVAQVIYAIINAVFMFTICLLDMGLAWNQTKPQFHTMMRYWLKPALTTMVLSLSVGAAVFSTSTHMTRVFAAQPAAPTIPTPMIVPVTNDMSTKQLVTQIHLVPQRVSVAPQDEPTVGMYSKQLE